MSGERNSDGTFANGNTIGHDANPEGKNGHLTGWQRYGDRLQKWLSLSKEEIEKLVASPEYNKLSSIDIGCVRHVAEIVGGPGWLEALEKGLDRIEGKPKQTVAHGGDPNNPTPITLDGVFTLAFGTDENDDRIARQIAAPKAKDADVEKA